MAFLSPHKPLTAFTPDVEGHYYRYKVSLDTFNPQFLDLFDTLIEGQSPDDVQILPDPDGRSDHSIIALRQLPLHARPPDAPDAATSTTTNESTGLASSFVLQNQDDTDKSLELRERQALIAKIIPDSAPPAVRDALTKCLQKTRTDLSEVPDDVVKQLFQYEPLSRLNLDWNSMDVPEEKRMAVLRQLASVADVIALNNAKPGLVKNYTVRLELKPGAKPFSTGRRQYNPRQREVIERHVQEMLHNDIIEKSDSPWAAGILLVPKKDGKMRFCVNLKNLNRQLKFDSYKLPHLNEAVSSFDGMKYFSSVDACSGFWAVDLDKDSRPLTAFATPSGLYQYKRLCFGLSVSPAHYCRVMDMALGTLRYECCLVYMDDIAIKSATFEEHLKHIDIVMDRLRSFNIHVKAEKCLFFQKELLFLGHMVSAEGIRPNPDKVKAVQDFKPPSTLKQLRGFLQLCSYFRKFIRAFSSIAEPLVRLLRKDVKYPKQFDEIQLVSFNSLKDALQGDILLHHPDWDEPFEVHTDGCPEGLGAVLVQKVDGNERVIQYLSRSLTRVEKAYSQPELEFLAIVWAIKTLRTPYLLGRKFNIVTDNKALTYVFRTKKSTRFDKWILDLQEFDFTISFRPGQANEADYLSRNPLPSTRPYRENDIPSMTAVVPETDLEDLRAVLKEHLPRVDLLLLPPPRDSTPERACQQDSTSDADGHEHPQCSAVPVSTRRPDHDGHQDSATPCPTTRPAPTPSLPRRIGITEFLSDPEAIVKREQHADPEWSTILKRLRSGDQVGAYVLRDDMVYLAQPDRENLRACVPRSLRTVIMWQHHGSALSGHLGAEKTEYNLRQRYYWKNLTSDVRKFCKSCISCRLRKTVKPNRAGLTTPILAPYPFHTLGMDIVGPLPETVNGHRYILTVIDLFTRWPIAIPIVDRSTASIMAALNKVLCVHSCPHVLLSDREFRIQVLKECCKKLGISKVESTKEHPQTNGHCERFHRYLNAALTIYSSKHKRDWDEYVDQILFAYRCSVNSTTGYSPFYLLYGRHPRLPLDSVFQKPNDHNATKETPDVASKLFRVYNEVRQRQERAALLNKRRRDENRYDVRYEPGDLVLFYESSSAPLPFRHVDTTAQRKHRHRFVPRKLQYKWSGPHRVVRRLPVSNHNNCYVIHHNRRGEVVANVTCLYPYTPYDDGCLPGPDDAVQTDVAEPPTSSSGNESSTDNVVYSKGDLVVVGLSDPDLPWAVAKILSRDSPDSSSEFTIQWYGNIYDNFLGIQRPGWIDGKGVAYYKDKPQHPSHQPYTNFTDASGDDGHTPITTKNLLFKLRPAPNLKLDSTHLQKLHDNPAVLWSRPTRPDYNPDVLPTNA